MNITFESLVAHVKQMDRELLRVKKRLASREAFEMMDARSNFLAVPIPVIEFMSQYGEDLLVWEVLGRPLNGFFIEAGAYDGYKYSVTYALEMMGWTGILVEPLWDMFQKCGENRPNSRSVNAALMGVDGEAVIERVDGGDLAMLSSTISTNQPHSLVSVNAITLNDLLKDANIIDLLVLDVEGAELSALQGMDFAKHQPRMMLIEDNSFGENPALSKFMDDKPYVDCGFLEVNRIYIHRNETAALGRIRAMGQ